MRHAFGLHETRFHPLNGGFGLRGGSLPYELRTVQLAEKVELALPFGMRSRELRM
jgi:hypothetical protein